ncbi:MAG: nucleotide pyrophosphohydrolase [Burkholderiales bacterium]
MTPEHNPLIALRNQLREFAEARNWEQFHNPKNLAMSVAIEAAEIMEYFQWLTLEQSRALAMEQRREVAHELADVMLYLIRLADVLGIDLEDAAVRKIALNALKYPANKG